MKSAELLNLSEVSRQLGIPRQTLYRYIADGLIETQVYGHYRCITLEEMARIKKRLKRVTLGKITIPVLTGAPRRDVV